MARRGPIFRTFTLISFLIGVFSAGSLSAREVSLFPDPVPSCDSSKSIDSLTLSSKKSNCGASNGAAFVDSVHGGSGSYGYTWTPDKGNNDKFNYMGLPSDTYKVTVTDSITGCSYVDSVFVAPGDLPGKLGFDMEAPSCHGGSDGWAKVQVKGGKKPYQFKWSTGDTTQAVTGLSAGTYYVDVWTDDNCHSSDTVTLHDPDPITLSIDSLAQPLCHGDSNGYGEVSAEKGSKPYSFEWSTVPASNGDQVNSLYAGHFEVSVTDDEGCSDTLEFKLGQPSPIQSSMSVQDVTCHGGSDGSVSVSVNGGTSPYQYDWKGYGGASGNTLSNIGAGTYIVEVTDANGCNHFDTAKVQQAPALSIDTTDLVHPTCYQSDDGSITVEGDGGTPPYSYNWSSLGQSGSSVSGLQAGIYEVELVDANGCSILDSFELKEPAPLQVQVDSIHDVSCHGASDGGAIASATGGNGGYSFSWNVGGTQSGTSVSGLSAGSYSVTVTDKEGCQNSTNFQVNEPSPVSLSLDSIEHPSCSADSNGYASVNATGGTAPYQYQWSSSPVQKGSDAQNLPDGSYSVVATDANGCTDSMVVDIQAPSPLDPSMTIEDPSCHGTKDGRATVSVSGGTAPYNYDWIGQASNQASLNNIGSGQYVVEVSDANGCTITDTAQLDDPAPLSVHLRNKSEPACHGDDTGSLSVSVSGGTTPYDHHWSGTSQNGPDIGGLSAGTYVLEVEDANGCILKDSFDIQEPTPVQVQIDSTFDASCAGVSDGAATASASGGTGPYSFTWNVDSVQNGNSAFGISGGTHSVTVTDDNGCTGTSSFTVDEPAPLQVQVQPISDTICPDDSISISANASGGNGQYFYVWGQGLGSGQTHKVAPSQTTDYKVTAYDSAGCSSNGDTVHIEVRQLDQRALEVKGNGPICEGDMAEVRATYMDEGTQVDYNWDHNIGSGKGPHHVLPNDSSTYTVTVTDQCQNAVEDSVEVAVHPKPPVKAIVPDAEGCGEAGVVCRNDTPRSVNTEVKWFLSTGDTLDELEPEVKFESSGKHSAKLMLTSQNGCRNTDKANFSVDVHPVPSAEFEMDPSDGEVSIMDPEIDLHYNDPYAIEWSFAFGDGDSSTARDPSHVYDEVGSYPVTLTAKTLEGCKAKKVKEIDVKERFSYFVPNAFSPDGDGVNDRFDGKGEGYTKRHMKIFDRWGELIFESHDRSMEWDGTVNGEKVKPDVYVYKIRVKDYKGEWHTKTGHVTVVR